MSMFDIDSTPVTESPEQGHEEVAAEEVEQEKVNEPTETVETEEETPSEEEHGDLLAGKYRTKEELANGYLNLQREFTKTRQQLSEMQKQQQPIPQPQQQQPSDPNEFRNRVIDMINEDPVGTINFFVNQGVQQALAPITAEREFEQLTKNFESITTEYREHIQSDDDLRSLMDKVGEIAKEFGNPSIAKNPSARVLKMAATELWGDSKASLYQKAKQAGKEEAEAARRAKQGLTAPTGAKPKETPKTAEQLIRESIVGAGPKGFFG